MAWWDDAPKVDAFDVALQAEGLTGKAADVARSIYQQESGGGRNTKTSNAGAVGGMQIVPATFASVADKGWDINDPVANARAGIRYVKQGFEAAGGDPALTGAFYYGGPGGLAKARQGVAVSDPRNPNAPTTLQYGQQVAARIPKERGLVQRAVEGMLPSANAAETPGEQWWASAPVVKDEPAPVEKTVDGDRPTARVEVRGTSADEPGLFNQIAGAGAQQARNLGGGLIRGAGSIGATLLAPVDAAARALGVDPNGAVGSIVGRTDRRQAMDAALGQMGSDTDSLAYGAGKLGAEVAGTAGVGSAVALPLRAAVGPLGAAIGPAANRLATSIGSAGMTVGPGGNALANLATRGAGGATAGYAGAGVVDPDTANTGAAIGGAVPVAGATAARIGGAIGRGLTGGGQVAPDVAALAQRADDLGIKIPADRLVNSRPLNAVAAGLNYVPLSGRAATEDAMQSQLNRALSRTFGQDSDNVTMALRQAQKDLGGKFDSVLKTNTVKVDQQLMQDLGDVSAKAVKELEEGQAGIINRQIDEIVAKAQNGDIDGQAAYNIKKTLDRIGQRSTPEAFYARDLKKTLMAALDRSLGPQQAAEFAAVRKQYGNMLDLEGLAQNGVDGNVSIARVANMKGLNNPDLQELADISAQFLKPREGQHGAAQRALAGGIGFGIGGLPALAGGMATGRVTNSLLNSNMARNALLGQPQTNSLLQLAGSNSLGQLGLRAAPVIGSQ